MKPTSVSQTATPQSLSFVVLIACFCGLLVGDTAIEFEAIGFRLIELRYAILMPLLAIAPLLFRSSRVLADSLSQYYLATLVIFFIYLCSTAMWSLPGAEALAFYSDCFSLLTYTCIGFIAAQGVSRDQWNRFWYAIVAISLLFALVGLATSGSGGGRISAFGGGPNVYVRIVGMGVLAAIYIAFRTMHLRWLVLAVPLVVATVLSGSRGGMSAVFTGLCIALLLGQRWLRERRRLLLFTSVGIMVAIGGIIVFGDALGEVLGTRFGEQFLGEGDTSGRDRLYAAGLDIWSGSPLIGNGLGSFEVLYGRGFTYTHNIVLDVLVDGGVLGLLLLILPLCTVWSLVRHATTSVTVAIPLTLGVMYFIASQFSGTYYDTRFVWFFFALACVARTQEQILRGEHNPNTPALPPL